MMLWLI